MEQVFGGTAEKKFTSLDKDNAAPHNFIMDSASIHTSSKVREYITNTYHHIHFLPAYNPFPQPEGGIFLSKDLLKDSRKK